MKKLLILSMTLGLIGIQAGFCTTPAHTNIKTDIKKIETKTEQAVKSTASNVKTEVKKIESKASEVKEKKPAAPPETAKTKKKGCKFLGFFKCIKTK